MIRNVFRKTFHNFYHKRVPPHWNFVMRHSVQAITNKPLPISNYLSIALFNFICVVHAQAKSIDEEAKDHKLEINAAITQSDKLFKMGKVQESLNVLQPFKDIDDAEVIWRTARALFNLSKENVTSKSKSKDLILEAYAEIQRALKLDDQNYAVHKWMAILHDAKCQFDGPKARLQALPVFKEHLMKAIELNPKDATSIYMLGQYMYSLADLSWFQKTIATTMFGKPPEGSFEEAFQYFSKAEEVEPNFYSANLLMLGKTCLKLKKYEAAQFWLKCASAYPVRTDEDEAVRLEAQTLLNDNLLAGTSTKTESQGNVQ